MKSLRSYQRLTVDKLHEAIRNREEDGLVCLPTGSGKTFTAMAWLKELRDEARSKGRPFHVLWVAHRQELLEQALEEAHDAGLSVNSACRTFVASKTYIGGDSRPEIALLMVLSHRHLQHFIYDVVLIDEAAHQAARSYQNLRERLDCSYYLGLTAVPERLDEQPLGFSRIVHQETFADLANQGYLARPTYWRINTGLRSNLRTRGREFTRASLNQLNREQRNRVIVDWIVEHRDKLGRILMFAVNVAHTEQLAEMLEERGLNTKCIHGNSPQDERRGARGWFEGADDAILLNCEVYTEGMDLPTTDTVVLARPTASRSLYLQMLGRGSRTAGSKNTFNIVDVVDMADKYAYLSTEWALDLEPVLEEGAEDLHEIMEEREEEEFERQVGRLGAEHGLGCMDAYRRASIDRIDFSGFLTYGSKFWKKHKTIAVTKQQQRAIAKLTMLLRKGFPVNSTFALCCPDEEFTVQKWTPIAWASFFTFVKGQVDFGSRRNITWKWTNFTSVPENTEMDAEMEEQDKVRLELNSRYESVNELWSEVNEKALEMYGDASSALAIFRPVSFVDMTLRVSFNGYFRENIWAEREALEDVLEAVAGRHIGLKVNYLKEDR